MLTEEMLANNDKAVSTCERCHITAKLSSQLIPRQTGQSLSPAQRHTDTPSQDINNIKATIKSVIKHIKSYNKSDDIIVESCCIRHQNTHFINHEVPQLVASRRSFVSKYILSNTVVSPLVTLLYLAQPARLSLHNTPSLLPITEFRQTSEVWLTATVITIN